ncbi:hypothetical protein [Kitasatospora sp. NPDC088134]|uniref:hypothetical protein n=1 Tax=Kitasatospora sp. NPDC088134 TaxID=3364071 RepID=UPI003800D127
MLELDGCAATAAIRESTDAGTVPIIAVTARAMPDDRARSLAADTDDDTCLIAIELLAGESPDTAKGV